MIETARLGRTAAALGCAAAMGLGLAACGSSGGGNGGLELIGDALDGKGPVSCEVYEADGAGESEYSGSLWVKDAEHYRAEFVMGAGTTYMLRDGDLLYGWAEGQSQGQVLDADDSPVDLSEEINAELDLIDDDDEAESDADEMYRCTTVSSVDDELKLPEDVEFTEM